MCRLNAAEMLVDVEKSKQGTETQWLADSGVIDLFIYLGPSIGNVRRHSGPTLKTARSHPRCVAGRQDFGREQNTLACCAARASTQELEPPIELTEWGNLLQLFVVFHH